MLGNILHLFFSYQNILLLYYFYEQRDYLSTICTSILSMSCVILLKTRYIYPNSHSSQINYNGQLLYLIQSLQLKQSMACWKYQLNTQHFSSYSCIQHFSMSFWWTCIHQSILLGYWTLMHGQFYHMQIETFICIFGLI